MHFELEAEKVLKEEFPARVSETIAPIQSLLTRIEQQLFAVKADNSCENNSKLMVMTMDLHGQMEALLMNLNQMGEDHQQKHHEERGSPTFNPSEEEIHDFLEMLFGMKRHHKGH